MNERIDELLWQSGGYTKLNYPNDAFLDGRYALTQEQLDKFAELIIRECADIALKSGNIANKSIEAKAEANRIYHKIQDHFGD